MLMHGVSMRCDKNSTHTQNPKLLSSMGLLNPKQYNSHNTQINFELLLLLLLLLSLRALSLSLSFVLCLIHSLTHRPFCSVLLGVSVGLFFSTSQTDYNVFSMRKRNDSCVHFCDFVKIFSRRWMILGMCARAGKRTSEWTNERANQAILLILMPWVVDNDSNCSTRTTVWVGRHWWQWGRRDNFTKFQLTNVF